MLQGVVGMGTLDHAATYRLNRLTKETASRTCSSSSERTGRRNLVSRLPFRRHLGYLAHGKQLVASNLLLVQVASRCFVDQGLRLWGEARLYYRSISVSCVLPMLTRKENGTMT